MVIDFHTHTFPDKIAARTVGALQAKSGTQPHSDGTVAGLIERMAEAGVDISVNLPVMTSPSQFESVTAFAAELNERFKGEERRIISFGGIHPDCEDIDGKMRRLKELGFLGVKIHPDYQATFINDEKYERIFNCAREYDLIVVTHAGVDAGFPGEPVRCPPSLALELIRKAPHSKSVFAHLGASRMAKEVLDVLAGEDIYIDTAYILGLTDPELVRAVIKQHGEDRVLFATDSPWSSMTLDLERIKALSLGKEREEKILSGNARALLGI